MSNSSGPPDPLQRIADALPTALGVAACGDVASLLNRTKADGAGFVIGKRIRVGDYYDIQPPITVYDPELGTLAFVEQIARTAPDARSATLKAIEKAAAVRQILIEDADRQSRQDGGRRRSAERKLALQVELVLLVSGAVPEKTADPLRTTLTSVARQTGYLRLIGLSVLDTKQNPELPDPPMLRRAFAWLLEGTRAWFSRDRFHPGATGWRTGSERLELQLQDYRMAGQRRFSCDGTAWLNLVHGHNGSGKSSLVEAMELLLTDRIQRLEDAGESNYFRVVRHRPSGVGDEALAGLGPAEVAMFGGDKDARSRVRIEHGKKPVREGTAPRTDVRANSFRIDQVFMDKLVRSQAAGRAALFLNAFSPGDATLLAKLQQLRAKIRKNWPKVPEHFRRKAELQAATTSAAGSADPQAGSPLTEELMAEFIVRELGALQTAIPGTAESSEAATQAPGTTELSAGAIEGLLPGDKKQMERLGQIHPPLLERMEALLGVRDATSLPDAVAQFQSSLASLLPCLPSHIADLNTALRLFQEFRLWSAGERIIGGDLQSDLRRWLELQALVDLTTKYADIVTTVEAARRADWEPDERDRTLLRLDDIPTGLSKDLASRRTELVELLSLARARVESPKGSAEADAVGKPSPGRERVRRWLSAPEVDALNRVGQFLLSTRGGELLGVRINRALASGREEKLADGTIGRSGGLDQPIDEATEILRACERVQQANATAGTEGTDVLLRTANLVRAARDFQSIAKELPQSFFHRLARGSREELNQLIAAFNELLALITPARWAYRDIQISPDLPNGDPALGFQTSEGAPADLLFNTAELNASALVLFLLLAPRLPNDLRLLVLDDPLQNMDELTVVTLARALAKLRIIYPRDWTVLAFFHGEENIRRIRDEAPCHIYHLPWLQSSESGEAEKRIESVPDENTWPADWQHLSGVLADPDAARRRTPQPIK